jgi:hypothetical protein
MTMTTNTISTDINAAAQPAAAVSKAPNPPSHVAYHVRDSKQVGKGFWTRIGSAWAHADGLGYTVQLDCVPVDGRISLRVATDRKE